MHNGIFYLIGSTSGFIGGLTSFLLLQDHIKKSYITRTKDLKVEHDFFKKQFINIFHEIDKLKAQKK